MLKKGLSYITLAIFKKNETKDHTLCIKIRFLLALKILQWCFRHLPPNRHNQTAFLHNCCVMVCSYFPFWPWPFRITRYLEVNLGFSKSIRDACLYSQSLLSLQTSLSSAVVELFIATVQLPAFYVYTPIHRTVVIHFHSI